MFIVYIDFIKNYYHFEFEFTISIFKQSRDIKLVFYSMLIMFQDIIFQCFKSIKINSSNHLWLWRGVSRLNWLEILLNKIQHFEKR